MNTTKEYDPAYSKMPLTGEQVAEMERAQNWRISNREAILHFVNGWLDEQARFLGDDRVIEIRLRPLLTEAERPKQGDPDCPMCGGDGCSQCNDDLWYAAEDAAEQARRERSFDRAQWRAQAS